MVEVTAIDRLFPSGATSALPIIGPSLWTSISEINATVERGATFAERILRSLEAANFVVMRRPGRGHAP
jgi:hypothetical protein